MEAISIPPEVLCRQPHVADDLEKQLQSADLHLPTSSSQPQGPMPLESPHTQPIDRTNKTSHIQTQDSMEIRNTSETKTSSSLRKRVKKHTGKFPFITGADYSGGLEPKSEGESEESSPSLSAHGLRKSELMEVLKPLTSTDSSVLLLCWGEADCCHILPAHIRDSANATAQWSQAQRAWQRHRTSWRSRLPWYGVKKVTVVKVTIAGPIPEPRREPPDLATFVGMYRPENLEAEISRLSRMDSYYWNDEFECTMDEADGTWNHALACPSTAGENGPGWNCPYEDRRKDLRYLLRLRRRPFLTAMFRNPDLAAWSESMEEQEFLLSHWKLFCQLQRFHRPNLGELSFPGLLIQEGLLFARPMLTLVILASAVLLLSVLTAWLVYNDWAVAWQVGGCFLAVAIFVCGCMDRAL